MSSTNRLPDQRRRQPHVRDDRGVHQVPAPGLRGADQVRAGERSHEDRGKNVISDYIPNPTFEVVAEPGAQQDYFMQGQPGGQVATRDPR